MPDRTYQSRHEPPWLIDRWMAHPGMATIAVWSIIAGAALLTSALVPAIIVSQAVDQFPRWLSLALSATVGSGGILATVGLLRPLRRLDTSWIIERAGWWLAGAGWASYGVAVLAEYPSSILAWGTSLSITLAAGSRLVALHSIERETRLALGRGA